MKHSLNVALAAVLLLALLGCPGGGSARPTVPPAAAATDAEVAAWRAEADARFAERAEEPSLRAAIAAYEKVVAARPGDADAWLRLARGRYLLADAFLIYAREAGDPAATREHRASLRAAADAALAGLRARSPELARLLDRGVPLADASEVLGPADAVWLYFWAETQMRWAVVSGTTTTIRHFGATFSAMERVFALEPGVWYGGPDRFFGVVYAGAPAIAGGDLGKSKQHFEASLARAPDFLETRVLYAQMWGTAAGDAAFKRAMLESVVDSPPAGPEDIRPEQRLAQRKAKVLLDQIGK